MYQYSVLIETNSIDKTVLNALKKYTLTSSPGSSKDVFI